MTRQKTPTYAEEQLAALAVEKLSMSAREDIMREAIKLTCGDRNVQYGPPVGNMQESADLWNAYLSRKLETKLTATDVSIMMALFKIARMMESNKRDTFADACAYIGIGWECAEESDKA